MIYSKLFLLDFLHVNKMKVVIKFASLITRLTPVHQLPMLCVGSVAPALDKRLNYCQALYSLRTQTGQTNGTP